MVEEAKEGTVEESQEMNSNFAIYVDRVVESMGSESKRNTKKGLVYARVTEDGEGTSRGRGSTGWVAYFCDTDHFSFKKSGG
jgi:hypothetical protein